MKLCSRIFAIASIVSTCALIGCAAPSTFSYQNVAVTLTAVCFDCTGGVQHNPAQPTTIVINNGGAGGCIQFTAHVTNAPANPTWTLFPTPNLIVPTPPTNSGTNPPTEATSQVGTVADPSGPTNFYCSPNGPPIYTGQALLQAQALGIPQGDVLMVVSVPSDPTNPSAVASASQMFQVYSSPSVRLSPSTPTGLTTSAVTIPHGTTYQFNGYAVGTPPCTVGANNCQGLPVGSTLNGVIWSVGAAGGTPGPVVGGSSTYGTITATGLYTAPVAIPALSPVITLTSQASATTTATAYVTIN